MRAQFRPYRLFLCIMIAWMVNVPGLLAAQQTPQKWKNYVRLPGVTYASGNELIAFNIICPTDQTINGTSAVVPITVSYPPSEELTSVTVSCTITDPQKSPPTDVVGSVSNVYTAPPTLPCPIVTNVTITDASLLPLAIKHYNLAITVESNLTEALQYQCTVQLTRSQSSNVVIYDLDITEVQKNLFSADMYQEVFENEAIRMKLDLPDRFIFTIAPTGGYGVPANQTLHWELRDSANTPLNEGFVALPNYHLYITMPENPQACLWDEGHPYRAGVFRGRRAP